MSARAVIFASLLTAGTVMTVSAAEEAPAAWDAPSVTNEAAIVDMRVAPFLGVKWGQGDVGGSPCYNYSTPYNLKAGCAAVAMGQVMRYWQYPDVELGVFSNKCEVALNLWDLTLGEIVARDVTTNYHNSSSFDGVVRSYDWSMMPKDPSAAALTDDNRSSIGALLADCAIALGSSFKGNYKSDLSENLGSVTGVEPHTHTISRDSFPEITEVDPDTMASVLRTHFGYTNACIFVCTKNASISQEGVMARIINANLDARQPVIIVFRGAESGLIHYAVADGYGFTKGADDRFYEYVHLNLGWEGKGDGWYLLPALDTSAVKDVPVCAAGMVFDSTAAVIYNISPSHPGPVVSGRTCVRVDEEVLDPVSGCEVRLYAINDVIQPIGVKDSDDYGVFGFPSGFLTGTNVLVVVHYNDPVKGLMAAEEWLPVEIPVVSEDLFMLNKTNYIGNLWKDDIVIEEANAIVDGVGYISLDRALSAAQISTAQLPVVEIVDEIAFSSVEWEIERDMVICSTLENPDAALVSRPGSGVIRIKEGVNVLFTNVCFQALGSANPVVEVSQGATCEIAGDTQIDAIRLLDGGLIGISSALNPERCYAVETSLSTNGVFGVVTDASVKDESAALFVHAVDERLGGFILDDGSLSWVDREPTDSAAFLKLVQDGTSVNYRSFDMLLKYVTNDCEVLVVKDCVYTNSYTLAHRMAISSYEGHRSVVSPAEFGGGESFTVPESTELVISNLTFTGHCGGQFITLAGGELILEDGAELVDIENVKTPYGGAVYAQSGKVTVRSGAVAANVRATAANGMGGFACISPDGAIELAGGVVTGCLARARGGAVYAAYQSDSRKAIVDVSGPSIVCMNEALAQSVTLSNGCDVFIDNANNEIRLTGDATGGCIGIQYASNYQVPRNAESNVFAAVEAQGLDAAVLATSAKAFFSNSDAALEGGVSEDGSGLVWLAQQTVVHYPLDESMKDQARAVVIYPDSAVTQYWERVGWALQSINADAELELLVSDSIEDKITITNNVVFFTRNSSIVCSQDASETYFDYTIGSYVYDRTIDILPGASLELSNVVFTASAAAGPLFNVQGSLTLDASSVSAVSCSSSVDDTAVWVPHGGVFTMKNSASLVNCSSTVSDSQTRVGSAVRSFGGTVNLNGCTVSGCSTESGCAMYFGGEATVCIGGEVSVSGNTSPSSSSPANIALAACRITLVSELAGEIGITPVFGAGGSDGVFAEVSPSYEGGFDSLTNSASMFKNDLTGDIGVVVTNTSSKVFIAWAGSISSDLTLEVDHETYYLVGDLPEGVVPDEPLAVPGPIAFTAIGRDVEGTWVLALTNAVAQCRYFLYSTNSLSGGFVIPDDGSGATTNFVAESDGEFIFTVPDSGESMFFRVLALPEVSAP